MSTRTRWTLNGALIGALPGVIGLLLTFAFAGCPDSPGEPGMVCYDIERFLLRIAGTATIGGLVLGGILGMGIAKRRSS